MGLSATLEGDGWHVDPITSPPVLASVDPSTGGRKLLIGGKSAMTIQADGANGAVMIDWADVTIGSPTSGWTVEKATDKRWGDRTSLKITATAGAADTMTCTLTIPSTFLGGAKRIAFTVCPGDAYYTGSDTYPQQLWFNYSASTTHRMQGYSYPSHAVGDWAEAVLFDQDASGSGHLAGTAQWAKVAAENVTAITLVMTKRAGQAVADPCYIGPVYTDPVVKPTAILSLFMDGQYTGQYDYARQILQAYSLRASMAIVVPWIGSVGGTMSQAQIAKMYSLGHECIRHTGTAGNFGWDNTSKYPDGQEYDLVKADNAASDAWAVQSGFERGRGYGVVGFTNGLANTQTLARRTNITNALRDSGLLKCRQLGTYNSSWYGNAGSPSSMLVTQSRMHQAADTTGTITGIVDQIIARGGWSGLTYHDIALSGATGNNVNVADFETVMDYIAGKVAAGTLRVLPFSEAMVEMSNVVPPQ